MRRSRARGRFYVEPCPSLNVHISTTHGCMDLCVVVGLELDKQGMRQVAFACPKYTYLVLSPQFLQHESEATI